MNWNRSRLKWDTWAGAVTRRAVSGTGAAMIRVGRALLRWSLGRCSWCGEDPGFRSAVSSRGLRCMSIERDCTLQESDPRIAE